MELPRKWFGATSKNVSALVLYWLVRILYVSFRSVLSRRVVKHSTGTVSEQSLRQRLCTLSSWFVSLVVHGFQTALFVSRFGWMITL